MGRTDLEVLDLGRPDAWLEAIESAGAQDVYYQPHYSRMLEANGEGTPRLAWLRCQDGVAVYPFLMRSIAIEGAPTDLHDIVSPYGYGGPVIRARSVEGAANVAAKFIRLFHGYCLDAGIVSEFIRFHPLLGNSDLFVDLIPTEYVRDTVYVDLQVSLDAIWQESIDGRTRNAVRKAQKLGVSVTCSATDGISDFVRLYRATMDRLSADQYYYFSDSYFDALRDIVLNWGVLIQAIYEGQVVASAVFLRGDSFLHYHLSASRAEYRSIQAGSLLLWEAIKWGQARRLSLFHLGGGYSGNEDSLFRFKAGFSPRRAKFIVGKVIHDDRRYKSLVSLASKKAAGDSLPPAGRYFPAYRLKSPDRKG